jgi:hypothetical protein
LHMLDTPGQKITCHFVSKMVYNFFYGFGWDAQASPGFGLTH